MSLTEVPQRPYEAVAGVEEGCGLIAYGQVCYATRRSGIRRVPRSSAFGSCGRSLAVSTEGADSSPSDSGKALEACEIGGLG